MTPTPPKTAEGAARKPRDKAPGLRIGSKLMLAFLGFALAFALAITLVYQKYVPELVMRQMDLRTLSVAQQLASAVTEPLVVRNYLRVNKIAEVTAKLPDVAYAATINKKGIPVAGIFGELERFDPAFAQLVKLEGFPKSLVEQHGLVNGAQSTKTIEVGGQRLREVVLPVADTGAEVRVATFISALEQEVEKTLIPLAITLCLLFSFGALAIYFIGRTVSDPIRQLTAEAQRISMGQLEQNIAVKGSGEIWELAQAFQRMQAAIRYAIEQLRRNRATSQPKD